MTIDHELRQFIEGPVMLIVGSVGGDGRTTIGRASGAQVLDGGIVALFVSHWQWPNTIENLLANPRMSLTATSPASYISFQLKGQSTLRPAVDGDVALVDRYIETTYRLMSSLGVPTTSDAAWFSNRELWEVRLAATEVFIQTPGPQAGQRREPA
jgi:hypothetical protein